MGVCYVILKDERQDRAERKDGMFFCVQHLVVDACFLAVAPVCFLVVLWFVFAAVAADVLYHLLFGQ